MITSTTPGITAELRCSIVRAAKRYGSPDPEDVAQIVLLDVLRLPHLALPTNMGALMQRTRYRTLHSLRAARRHDARGNSRFTSYEAMAESDLDS